MTPDDFTNQEFTLDVNDGHQLYVHDWGKTDARVPVIYLHGGPGNGCDDSDKRKFNPETQRVIFFDQRGAGKSVPQASLENNTTSDLVEDIEKLAQHLHIDKFVLCGGSWGSTLALAYAIAHPERVAAMVIDGVFTATKEENDWLEKGGWRTFFPEVWEDYSGNVPAEFRDHPSKFYFEQALSGDQQAAKKAAYAFNKMEVSLLKLAEKYPMGDYEKYEPGGAQIEIHYLKNNCFLAEGFIQDNAAKLIMPIRIIEGRYDMVCPPKTAYALDRILPDSKLIWTISGHVKEHEAKNVLSLLLDQLTGAV